MDRQRPVVLSAAAISLVIAVFALVMAWTTTDDGSDAAGTTAPPAAQRSGRHGDARARGQHPGHRRRGDGRERRGDGHVRHHDRQLRVLAR